MSFNLDRINWTTIDSDNNGNIVAASRGGFVYIGTSSDQNDMVKVEEIGSRQWVSVSMSDDGSIILAVPILDNPYIRINGIWKKINILLGTVAYGSVSRDGSHIALLSSASTILVANDFLKQYINIESQSAWSPINSQLVPDIVAIGTTLFTPEDFGNFMGRLLKITNSGRLVGNVGMSNASRNISNRYNISSYLLDFDLNDSTGTLVGYNNSNFYISINFSHILSSSALSDIRSVSISQSIDDNIYISVGLSSLQYSTNRGLSWIGITSLLNNTFITKPHFASVGGPRRLYAISRNNLSINKVDISGGAIIVKYNGSDPNNDYGFLSDIHTFENNIVVCSNNGFVYNSTNNGETFTKVPGKKIWTQCANLGNAGLYGISNNILWKYINNTWVSIRNPPPSVFSNSAVLNIKNNLILVSYLTQSSININFYLSTDGGNTWPFLRTVTSGGFSHTPITMSNNGYLACARFVSSRLIDVVVSSNFGASFATIQHSLIGNIVISKYSNIMMSDDGDRLLVVFEDNYILFDNNCTRLVTLNPVAHGSGFTHIMTGDGRVIRVPKPVYRLSPGGANFLFGSDYFGARIQPSNHLSVDYAHNALSDTIYAIDGNGYIQKPILCN